MRTKPWHVSLNRRATSDLQQEVLETPPSLLFENRKIMKTKNCENKFDIAYSVSKKYSAKIKETCLYLRNCLPYLDRTVRLLRLLDHLIFPATKND